ncbi:head decoration protein [Pseudovibrio sp. POLY-S9]|uniref:head decoration protein n=1 Tax=Pseudovibrio sp. POLY-S9 TaxID=1576596 RepID=UPI00070B6375|nr:head decoration protein [Pseudovibrio sp. POLY-S9]
METKVQGARNWAFLLSAAHGNLSVDTITLAEGQGTLEAGTVLGKVTENGEYVMSPAAEEAGKEGAETATAILAVKTATASGPADALVVNGLAEVKSDLLIFDGSVAAAAKISAKHEQLAAAFIKVR